MTWSSDTVGTRMFIVSHAFWAPANASGLNHPLPVSISRRQYSLLTSKVITKEGLEWLCKNCFKQKYLELLESYKMNLTEKFIKAGYIYDNFFNKN